jgi:hypothetical protein
MDWRGGRKGEKEVKGGNWFCCWRAVDILTRIKEWAVLLKNNAYVTTLSSPP